MGIFRTGPTVHDRVSVLSGSILSKKCMGFNTTRTEKTVCYNEVSILSDCLQSRVYQQRGGKGKNIPSLPFVACEHSCLLLLLAAKGICMNAPCGWEQHEAAVFPGYDFH